MSGSDDNMTPNESQAAEIASLKRVIEVKDLTIQLMLNEFNRLRGTIQQLQDEMAEIQCRDIASKLKETITLVSEANAIDATLTPRVAADIAKATD